MILLREYTEEYFLEQLTLNPFSSIYAGVPLKGTAWKVSKYGAFSGPYFTVFRLNTSDWIQENTDQKKLGIWTVLTQ